MNKERFIKELKIRLKRLPKEEVDNIIEYYLDYFQDADKSEEEVINELGSPSSIASQILADYAFNPEVKEKKSPWNTILLVILSIFAAPIALPLALAFVAVLFALIITFIAIIFSIAAVAVSVFFGGIASSVMGVVLLFQGPATGILYIGRGLLAIGIGLLFVALIRYLSPRLYSWIKNFSQSIIGRINKPKALK